MESNETDAGRPEEESGPIKRKKLRGVWWLVLSLITAGIVIRYGTQYHKSAVERGDEIAKEVATLSDKAQKAKETEDVAQAKESLTRAIMLIRDAEQFKTHPVYVSTLIDLGALLLSSKTSGESEVAEGRQFLAEAWEVAKGLDARTRWRIARDLGLGAVLAGDMAEAEKWYTIATELVPDDKTSRERLETLKSAKKWK